MFAEMSIAAVLFTLTVVALALLVMIARSWLSPQKLVEITINRTPKTLMFGQNLLRSLSGSGVYLPSPCGGKAMCGECKLTYSGIAPPALPTEAGHLTRREINQGVRLACTHRVEEGISLELPEALLNAAPYACTVHSVQNISTYLREVTLDINSNAVFAFQAGQYIMIQAPAYKLAFKDIQLTPDHAAIWKEAGILGLHASSKVPTTRAYSLANAPNDSRLALVVRIATPPPTANKGTPPGIVSSYIFSLKPGDKVAVTGPFGDFHATQSQQEMMLIAGGAGIAPIRSIIRDQLINQLSTRKIVFWYGARALNDLCYTTEFDSLAEQYSNFTWHIALSAPDPGDGWQGYTGFVHDVVYEQQLKHHPTPELIEYYLCGPPVMSVAVTQMLEDIGVDSNSIYFDDFGS